MMSGGVDSNVVAYLLKQQGHDVIGLTLSLWWDSDANTCCGVAANCRAKDVCEKLGIEHFALNKRMDFMKFVVNPYIEAHKAGTTPSPCLNCNTNVKIGGMLRYADYFNCDYIATGHYARIIDGKIALAADPSKDQTYMLSRVRPDIIARLMLPLGNMLKTEVRAIAEANGIYAPSDSQDLCFVESADRSEFLQSHGVQFEDGDIVNSVGTKLGDHGGVYNYTVGQRKGLPASNDGPLYVLRINRDKNQVVVGSENDLLTKNCVVKDFNWQHTPSTSRVKVKIRYRAPAVWASYEKRGNELVLTFDDSQKAITPGQAAVLYDNDTLIGGGWII
jgi:tRNA-specific 2-thiouridylase